MQATQAKTVTVLTIGTMFGLGMGKSIIVDQQFPPFRFFAATGFAAFLLAAAADVEPEVAGPFALLILTVVFLEEAPPLIQALDGTTPVDPHAKKAPKTGKALLKQMKSHPADVFARATPLSKTPPKLNPATKHIH